MPLLNLLGTAAVLLMLLVEAHQRSFQYAFIARARRLEVALAGSTVAEVVSGTDHQLLIPGLASTTRGLTGRFNRLRRVAQIALSPGTYVLYLGLCLGLVTLTVLT